MIELYHDWDSIMSFKVRMCLSEKGIPWTLRLVELTRFGHLREEYLALNPNGVVPTLVHDGNVVVESSVINEYLDEVFPDPPLVPRDPLQRARMRSWVKYGDDVLHHGIRPATFELMIKTRLHGYTEEDLEKLVRNHPQPARAQAYRKAATESVDLQHVAETVRVVRTILGRMEQSLSQHCWLACEMFTLADVMAAPFLDRVDHLGLYFMLMDFPATDNWAKRLMARDSVRLSAPPDEHRLPGPDLQVRNQLVSIYHDIKK